MTEIGRVLQDGPQLDKLLVATLFSGRLTHTLPSITLFPACLGHLRPIIILRAHQLSGDYKICQCGGVVLWCVRSVLAVPQRTVGDHHITRLILI